ncbi:hypothetical protein O6H91_09G069800 [Diphasiastrum complanatum]|uniref:Uncharacterized protein n=1 Tax=Diphasiastrum complanatum TaxID=34168 RepID=A0ACC2CQF6_DIPCM|nr:hypothetical protein O6H91_09G069800 [Diphasiastrum complanatum]
MLKSGSVLLLRRALPLCRLLNSRFIATTSTLRIGAIAHERLSPSPINPRPFRNQLPVQGVCESQLLYFDHVSIFIRVCKIVQRGWLVGWPCYYAWCRCIEPSCCFGSIGCLSCIPKRKTGITHCGLSSGKRGLQLGGGVSLDNASSYLDAGASHVIVTSYVFSHGRLDSERLRLLVHGVGKQRLVLDLSCRKKDGEYVVVTDRWQRFSELVLNEETLANLASSAAEFLVHGVDVEGKRLGIEEDLVRLLGKWSPIPVTYAGGATSIKDLDLIKDAGNGSVDVTVGSALDIFGGDLPYQEVVSWHRKQLQ